MGRSRTLNVCRPVSPQSFCQESLDLNTQSACTRSASSYHVIYCVILNSDWSECVNLIFSNGSSDSKSGCKANYKFTLPHFKHVIVSIVSMYFHGEPFCNEMHIKLNLPLFLSCL